MIKIIRVFKSRIIYVINYFLKPLFYLHHYSSKKFDFDWEASNAKNERINISVLAWLIEYFFQGQMFTTEPITNPSIIENVEFLCLKKSLLRILLSKSKPIIAPIKNVDII